MKKKIIFIFLPIIMILSCNSGNETNEREVLNQKVLAFAFLSEYHHQLHIMIGEEEGDKMKAFLEFKDAPILQTNVELIPVNNALKRISNVQSDSISVMRLDDLVDYYQSGLSIQIEAILKGYGFEEVFSIDAVMDIYDDLIKN